MIAGAEGLLFDAFPALRLPDGTPRFVFSVDPGGVG